MLTLKDYSSAAIIGTSSLEQGYGGIWTINSAGYSTLALSGGEVFQLAIVSYATATLSGGLIESIWSYQSAYTVSGLYNPHITIDCQLETIFHDTQTNLLTGDWLDGSAFSIQLVDVDGYSPAIENILFIPEPATLILLTTGVLLLRKARY